MAQMPPWDKMASLLRVATTRCLRAFTVFWPSTLPRRTGSASSPPRSPPLIPFPPRALLLSSASPSLPASGHSSPPPLPIIAIRTVGSIVRAPKPQEAHIPLTVSPTAPFKVDPNPAFLLLLLSTLLQIPQGPEGCQVLLLEFSSTAAYCCCCSIC